MSGSLSFSFAAIACFTVGIVLLFKSRNGDIARRASLGAFISAIWAAVLAGQSYVGGQRGLIAAVLIGPLAWGVWRMPASEVRVFVSRHVVFYSSAFVAVGLYLSLMAIGGYYVREHGGSWGNALQVVFLGGAAAILVSML